jgi:hypothetical protein
MTDFDKMYPAWSVTEEEAKKIGDRLGVDWNRFPLAELRKGIEVEFEHNSDIVEAARVALEHLIESETYYSDLEEVETMSKNAKILVAFLRGK